MKRTPTILAAALAAFALSFARAEDPQPSAPAPAPATAAEAPAAAAEAPAPEFRYAAPPPAKRVAIPKPPPDAVGRILPRGPKFDKLPPDEKEHIRKMAEFRIARDEAEKELVELDKAVDARRAEILAENEEAKALSDKIAALREEYAAATNALETLFRADEKLAALAEKVEPARLIVENSQYELNAEVAAAMHKRMAAMRKAYEESKPEPQAVSDKTDAPPAEGAEGGKDSAGPDLPPDTIAPEDAPPGTVPGVSPDIKAPLDPAKRIAPPAKPAAK